MSILDITVIRRYFNTCPITIIVEKTNVTFLQNLLSSHSMLINGGLTQKETGFSTKEPNIANLQH